MFDIELRNPGDVVVRGRLDAAQSDKAEAFLDSVDGEFVIDLSELEYISSSGLGVLLKTHKQLHSIGACLRLVHVNKHINDIFKYSGFDQLFDIQAD
jgi:anti-sigma B factor antagonist